MCSILGIFDSRGGVDTGAQPLLADDGNLALEVDGEIYNHEPLEQGRVEPCEFQTHADCEVLLPLCREQGTDFLEWDEVFRRQADPSGRAVRGVHRAAHTGAGSRSQPDG